MAEVGVAAIGAAIGDAVVTGTVLGMTGAQLGWLAGSLAGSLLFAPKIPDGPKLSDLNLQGSSYGAHMARHWGTNRYAGVVIWKTPRVPHEHEHGKGGGYTTTTYTASFAISFGRARAGGIVGFRRLWFDGKLVYDASAGNEGPTTDYQATSTTFYLGTLDQPVDPTIQAHEGSAPAYRGQPYIVFTDLDIEPYGQRLPNVEAEVVQYGSVAVPPPLAIGTGVYGAMQPGTPYFWSTAEGPGDGETTVYINDVYAKDIVKSFVIPMSAGVYLDYVGFGDEFWVARSGAGVSGVEATALSAGGMVASRTIEFSTAATQQNGLVRYISSSMEVFFASVNGTNNSMQIVTPAGVAVAAFDPGFWATEALDLPEIRCVSAVGDTQLTGSAQRIVLIDALSRSIRYVFDAPTYNASGRSKSCHAWDSTRLRIMWTHESQLGHCYLLDVASGITGGPVQTFFPTALSEPVTALIYHKQLDRFIAHGTTTTYVIHPETFAIERSVNQGQAAAYLYELDGVTDYVLGTNSGTLYRYYLLPRITPARLPLSNVVSDISDDCGLVAANDINVTDITDTLVDGFTLARQGSGRSAIEMLMMAYPMDAVDSFGKIKFVRRGRKATLSIPVNDLGAHEPGQAIPTPLRLKRADEVELPRSIVIKYLNKDADYQTGAQMARRQATSSKNDITWELPVVMTDEQGLAAANAAIYSRWAARTSAQFSTTLKHADVEPTDLRLVDGNAVYITQRKQRGNMVDFEGALDTGSVFISGAVGGVSNFVPQVIAYRSTTAIEMMDTRLLRDQDDNAGFYVAAGGYAGLSWPGCVLLKSDDGGASWTEVLTLTQAATMGAAVTVLGDFSRNLIDEANTVTVRLRSGTLSSVSLLAMRNGANAALLGDELIKFRTATLNADGSYTLSGLLRGRKGSPTSGHAIGERFVLLNTASVRRVDMATAEIGMERLYKAVTLGSSLASARTIAFTNTAIGLECLSPVQLGGGRDAAGNLTLKWVRRTRIGGEWRNYVDASLGETAESYEVEIWNSTFTTLKRTISGLSSPTTSYSAADQTTDFGGTQATVYARVYQLSATVGRGFALQGAI